MDYRTFGGSQIRPSMSVPPIQTGNPVAGTGFDDEIGGMPSRKAETKEFSEDSGPEDAYDSDGKNPFLDEAVAEHWRQVYHESQYECRHVFDPALAWSEEEEKAIIRKLDWRVCLWACVMFFGLQVDRGNLIQAVSDNMLDDLGLNTNGEIQPISDSFPYKLIFCGWWDAC
jgi:hypothetical protein